MSKHIQLITNLQKLTINQEIVWRASSPPEVITRMKDEHIQTCYITNYRGADFYLYLEKYRDYFGEFDTWGFSERVILNIVEGEFITWENYQDQGPLRDLLRIVMNSASNLDRFF
jgi:hypothetical protein